VDALLRDIPSSQIEECMAYTRVEPWGDDWEQAAMIGSISSTAASNFKYTKPLTQSELIPRVIAPEPSLTDAHVGGTVMSLIQQCSELGGRA